MVETGMAMGHGVGAGTLGHPGEEAPMRRGAMAPDIEVPAVNGLAPKCTSTPGPPCPQPILLSGCDSLYILRENYFTFMSVMLSRCPMYKIRFITRRRVDNFDALQLYECLYTREENHKDHLLERRETP